MTNLETLVLQNLFDGYIFFPGRMNTSLYEPSTEDDTKAAVTDDMSSSVANLALLAASTIASKNFDECVGIFD